MKIDGSKLIIYDGDKPIEVSTEPVLSIPVESGLVFTEKEESYTFTASGIDEIMNSDEYRIAHIWRQIQSMPRKKKKRIKTLLKKGYTMNVTFV